MNSREILHIKSMLATLAEIEERLDDEIYTRLDYQADSDDAWHRSEEGRAHKSRTNMLVEQKASIRKVRDLLLNVKLE